jgi:gamma-glutamylcyclotransferase (GGCT)/AIG2-like uncharacterized protein YtfP
MEAGLIMLFVYGTLMRGERNHRTLRGARFAGEVQTLARYTLLDLGGFPALQEGGTSVVKGELWEVPPDVLARVDRLEGHPGFYRRGPVQLEGSAATRLAGVEAAVEGYLLPISSLSARTFGGLIEGGDWRQHRAAESEVES